MNLSELCPVELDRMAASFTVNPQLMLGEEIVDPLDQRFVGHVDKLARRATLGGSGALHTVGSLSLTTLLDCAMRKDDLRRQFRERAIGPAASLGGVPFCSQKEYVTLRNDAGEKAWCALQSLRHTN